MEVKRTPKGLEAVLENTNDLDAATLAYEGIKIWRERNTNIRPAYFTDDVKDRWQFRRLGIKLNKAQERQENGSGLPLTISGVDNLRKLGAGAFLLMYPDQHLYFPREKWVDRPISDEQRQSLVAFYEQLAPAHIQPYIPGMRTISSIERSIAEAKRRQEIYDQVMRRRREEGADVIFLTGGSYNHNWD